MIFGKDRWRGSQALRQGVGLIGRELCEVGDPRPAYAEAEQHERQDAAR